jgi:hypothetical protein
MHACMAQKRDLFLPSSLSTLLHDVHTSRLYLAYPKLCMLKREVSLSLLHSTHSLFLLGTVCLPRRTRLLASSAAAPGSTTTPARPSGHVDQVLNLGSCGSLMMLLRGWQLVLMLRIFLGSCSRRRPRSTSSG